MPVMFCVEADASRLQLQQLSETATQCQTKLLWLINAPAERLVKAINGVGRNLAVVVDQGVKENKFSS